MIPLLLIILMFVLLLSGMPIAFALALFGIILIYFYSGGLSSFFMIPRLIYGSLDNFDLSSIPLFIFMSYLFSKGKLGEDLYEAFNKYVRHFPGGLAIGAVLSCAFFAAISGSSVSTAATIGIVAVPAMITRGYEKKFTYGLLAAGGTLGILIPPSIPFILYGAVTNESVGKLFMAGMIPGIVLSLCFIGYAIFASRRMKEAVVQPRASWGEKLGFTRKVFWGLLLPVFILGGIYLGIFTPTEAAGIGSLAAFILCYFVYRTISLRDLFEITKSTVSLIAIIFVIIMGSKLISHTLTILQIPQKMTEMVISYHLSSAVFLVFTFLVLLILGCFLEPISILLITVPLIYPILPQLGIDPILFAVFFVVNMELAFVTPPVGMNLYVIQSLQKGTRFEEVCYGVFPFIIIMTFFLVLIMVFPKMSLWLPGLMR